MLLFCEDFLVVSARDAEEAVVDDASAGCGLDAAFEGEPEGEAGEELEEDGAETPHVESVGYRNKIFNRDIILSRKSARKI